MHRRLSGSYSVSTDEKGRVHIPSVLSKQLGDNENLKIAVWGGSLAVYPMEHFDVLTDQLYEMRKDPEKRAQVTKVIRSFYDGSFKSGKLLVPQEIRKTFDLERKVQVNGEMDHLIIYNQSDWDKQTSEEGDTEVSSYEELSDLGLV